MIRSFKAKIRMHASEMLGCTFIDSPIPVASDKEAQAFEQHKHPGPSRADFRLHLSGSLTSKWNKQAAAVFSEEFINLGFSDHHNDKDIKHMFSVHLATLRAQYKKQLTGTEEPTQVEFDRQTEDNREHRRRALRERRSSAVSAHSHLARFQNLWDTIPYTAMSGDESDHSRGKVRYVVLTLSGIREMAVVFDWMHLWCRFTPEGRPKHGAFPRYRRRGSMRLERGALPVKGLPVNCYDTQWLAGLDLEDRHSLNIQPAADLTHTNTVMTFVSLQIFHVTPLTLPSALLADSPMSRTVQHALIPHLLPDQC
ncbi:uncharacterized protein LAESUDRAFT_658585 [Laetiporus sulphureus 93-53]|uniref:Uncharacterized protein n=1 Tax=Laetiporus sulphureus 93-53 TaxID=1314785 RepID=A0A165D3M1_9APHY|nr:uncharacterized protein LAESUDRAFT_658585 [Laetiporus sulphureus 93-53]KZT04093.1 hypothetical protein LAESUDRAFT_658585 [Laetiporus sulphureus 93-53]